MPDTPAFLSERMRQEGQKTLAFFQDLPLEAWDAQVYTEGTCWTVHKILAHFVASETGFGLLMRSVMQGGEGSPEGLNIDDYNEEWVTKLEGLPQAELLKRFQEARQANADLVSSLGGADLERTGRHPFLGIAPMADIIKLVYRHNAIHMRDIRQHLAQAPGAA
jgi:hypothetical protein